MEPCYHSFLSPTLHHRQSHRLCMSWWRPIYPSEHALYFGDELAIDLEKFEDRMKAGDQAEREVIIV